MEVGLRRRKGVFCEAEAKRRGRWRGDGRDGASSRILSVQKHWDDPFHNQNLKRGVSTIRGFRRKLLNLREKKNRQVGNKNVGGRVRLPRNGACPANARTTTVSGVAHLARVSLHLVDVQFLRDWRIFHSHSYLLLRVSGNPSIQHQTRLLLQIEKQCASLPARLPTRSCAIQPLSGCRR